MIPRVAILDYGCGNLRSVVNAVREVAGEPFLVTDPVICVNERPTHYILPGQGHYGKAIATLVSQGWIDFLRGPRGDLLRPNRPILGICLGMQVMCEESEEAPGIKGLGWIAARCTKLKAERLPHVGWNTVGELGNFYFCHSYALDGRAVDDLKSSRDLAFTGYEQQAFVSLWREERLWAVQFHPEKSGKAGLALLAEFLKL